MNVLKFLEPLTQSRLAALALDAQANSAKDRLIYENEYLFENQHFILLNENALGAMWELGAIAQEILDKEHLISQVSSIGKLFELVGHEALSFQFIYINDEGSNLLRPSYIDHPNTFAQQLISERASKVLSKERKIYSRRVFLTARLEMGSETLAAFSSEAAKLDAFESRLKATASQLQSICDTVEYQLGERVKLRLSRCGGKDLVWLARKFFSSSSQTGQKSFPYRPTARLSDQIIHDFLKFKHDGIGVGSDSIEVLSWADKGEASYIGMMAECLNPMNLDVPAIVVLNLRAQNDKAGLDSLIQATKNGGDAYKERQYLEAVATEERTERGEKLVPASFHIIVKNVGVNYDAPKAARVGERLARKLSSCLETPLITEKFAAFPIFMSCLPFGYSKKVSGFIKREYRILTGDLPAYIPLFSGSQGDRSTGMLLHSRSGEAIWVDPRASHTNPHVAILGESGAGKSFKLCNLIVSDLAKNPDQIIFHIDNITSSEYLVRALGEESKVRIVKPPEEFPALFRGEMTPERLPVVIDILSVAAELVSDAKLTATEKVVLGEAIVKAFITANDLSKIGYKEGSHNNLGIIQEKVAERMVIRLSEVLNFVPIICADKELPEEIGNTLWNIFTPFIGSGPYAMLFDSVRREDTDTNTPLYSLYDLEGITNDRILRTLTTLLITAEIMSEISKPQNKNKLGMLIIDELGVNLSGKSEALVEFVQTKWPVFRKLGIMCIGITNKVEHYTDLDAPSTVWQISGNRIILPLSRESVQKAKEKNLLSNPYHLELAASLEKRNGEFSQSLYLGSSFQGTVEFRPTGLDYWPAINEGGDVALFKRVLLFTQSYQKAISYLAKKFPLGARDPLGRHRPLSSKEIQEIESDLKEVQ